MILESLWMMPIHHLLHEENALCLYGTYENCFDEFYAKIPPKSCRHRYSHDHMPLMDCNFQDIMIILLEGGLDL